MSSHRQKSKSKRPNLLKSKSKRAHLPKSIIKRPHFIKTPALQNSSSSIPEVLSAQAQAEAEAVAAPPEGVRPAAESEGVRPPAASAASAASAAAKAVKAAVAAAEGAAEGAAAAAAKALQAVQAAAESATPKSETEAAAKAVKAAASATPKSETEAAAKAVKAAASAAASAKAAAVAAEAVAAEGAAEAVAAEGAAAAESAKKNKAAEAVAEAAQAVQAAEEAVKVENPGLGNPMANQLTGEVMDAAEINIAGATFHILYDEKSKQNRKNVFLREGGKYTKLKKSEQDLLKHLCIEGDTYDAVRMYLYDFFEALPNCQSSAAILSNRQCEVSYYVLWSVLLKARQDVQRKIDEATSQSLIDSKLLQYQARLKSMTSRDLAPYDGPKPCDDSKAEHKEIMNMIEALQIKINSLNNKPKLGGGGIQKFSQKAGAFPMGVALDMSEAGKRSRLESKCGYIKSDIPLLESFGLIKNGIAVKGLELNPNYYRDFINWLAAGPVYPIPRVTSKILCFYRNKLIETIDNFGTPDGTRQHADRIKNKIDTLLKSGKDGDDLDKMCLSGGLTHNGDSKEEGESPREGDESGSGCCDELKDEIHDLTAAVEEKISDAETKIISKIETVKGDIIDALSAKGNASAASAATAATADADGKPTNEDVESAINEAKKALVAAHNAAKKLVTLTTDASIRANSKAQPDLIEKLGITIAEAELADKKAIRALQKLEIVLRLAGGEDDAESPLTNMEIPKLIKSQNGGASAPQIPPSEKNGRLSNAEQGLSKKKEEGAAAASAATASAASSAATAFAAASEETKDCDSVSADDQTVFKTLSCETDFDGETPEKIKSGYSLVKDLCTETVKAKELLYKLLSVKSAKLSCDLENANKELSKLKTKMENNSTVSEKDKAELEKLKAKVEGLVAEKADDAKRIADLRREQDEIGSAIVELKQKSSTLKDSIIRHLAEDTNAGQQDGGSHNVHDESIKAQEATHVNKSNKISAVKIHKTKKSIRAKRLTRSKTVKAGIKPLRKVRMIITEKSKPKKALPSRKGGRMAKIYREIPPLK